MMQNVSFIGRTTTNARLNFTASKTAVANFDLAINRKNNKSQADFIPCVIWGDKAKEFVDTYGKGSQVYIKGEFRSTKIEVEDGRPRNELKFEVNEFYSIDAPKPVIQTDEEESEE